MEYGLCCLFRDEDIKFKTFTLKSFSVEKAHKVYEHNIFQLQKAFDYCKANDIKSYRISSDILPKFGKLFRDGTVEIEPYLERLKRLESYDLVLSLHPDQFVNLASLNPEVVLNSVEIVKDHLMLSKYLNISDINIHIGGRYGDREATKKRFIENVKRYFSEDEIKMITVENDELNYSIDDVLEVCNSLRIRATYDIHHERCFQLGKEIDEESNFLKARETWRDWSYQRVHLSSPRDGYSTPSKSRPHHDFIDKNDFPKWLKKYENLHIDIEAKAKEVAIQRLKRDLA